MLTEYHTHEMLAATERMLRDALKFGTAGEVDTKKGGAHAEGLLALQSAFSEVGTPQVEPNGAGEEAQIL